MTREPSNDAPRRHERAQREGGCASSSRRSLVNVADRASSSSSPPGFALERHAGRGVPLAGRHRQPDLPAHRHAPQRAPARRRSTPSATGPRPTSGRSWWRSASSPSAAASACTKASRRSFTATIRRSELGDARWAYAVLGVSMLLESYSFSVAMREFRHIRAGRGVRRTLKEARDPDGADGAVRGSGGAVRPGGGVRRHRRWRTSPATWCGTARPRLSSGWRWAASPGCWRATPRACSSARA